jgi:hypothetical protein
VIFTSRPYRHDMGTILSAIDSIFAFRFRSRASLELKLIASCADSGPGGLSFHLSTGCCGFGCTGFGRR